MDSHVTSNNVSFLRVLSPDDNDEIPIEVAAAMMNVNTVQDHQARLEAQRRTLIIDQMWKWVEQHEQHLGDDYFWNVDLHDCKDVFLTLLHPKVGVNEYDEPWDNRMYGQVIENGCDYVFEGGPRMSQRCNSELVEGKRRCLLHDHVIFTNWKPQFWNLIGL